MRPTGEGFAADVAGAIVRIVHDSAGMPGRPGEAASGPFVDQPRGFDLLALPGLRRLLRWRYARFAFQLPLVILALLVIVDGLTGMPMAARNVATTGVWIHYRGLVVIALALFGNAFCGACPLMLTRGLTRRLQALLPRVLPWPRGLRHKGLVLVLTLAVLWSYEVFGLWSSPWLTAWLAIAYVVGALAVDTLFPAGTFCRYVCPLGNFNFVLASVSPTQVAAVDPDVCRACDDKPCLHGREVRSGTATLALPGCETGLMVPTVTSNMDCTYCFNCVRACPYDNVALRLREPGRELAKDPWSGRRGVSVQLLGVLLAVWAIMNALAMIGPFQALAGATARLLGSHDRGVIVLALYLAFSVAGLALVGAFAWAADRIAGAREGIWRAFRRWSYVMVALGFGFWTAHYLFHFLTGAAGAVPVLQNFLAEHGVAVTPDWRLERLVPASWLFPVQAVVTAIYAVLAMGTAFRIGVRDFGRQGVLAMWPMLLLALLFAAVQVLVLAQPMQMRGTMMMGMGG